MPDGPRCLCNNTMLLNIGTGKRAGFIHAAALDADTRARFARVVEAAVQAAVDAP